MAIRNLFCYDLSHRYKIYLWPVSWLQQYFSKGILMFDMQIEVVGKSAGVATQLQGTIVELTEVSIVKLSLHPRDVSSTSQIGKDLVVKLVNGESITIKNFFITEGDDKSELVLEDDEGALWYAQYDYPLTEMVFVEASDSVVLGWAEWGLGALALLGLAVGACNWRCRFW